MRRRSWLDAVITALLLIAAPVCLVLVVGTPGHRLGGSWSGMLQVASLGAWAAWAWCLGGVVVEVVRRVRSQDLTAQSSAGSLTRLAIQLAGIILSLCATAGPIAAAQPASAPATPPVALSSASSPASPSPTSTPPSVPSPPTASTWTVVTGDCLWTIAERLEGDGDAWTLLAAANLGRTMSDGRIFTDPSLIFPEWDLIVPPEMLRVSLPIPPPPPPAPVAAPAPTRASAAQAPPAAQDAHPLDRSASMPADISTGAVTSAAALGLGAVAGGLLLRRRRQTKVVSASDEVLDAEVLLAQSTMLPGLTLTEAAVLLAAADDVLQDIALLEVGPDGARLVIDGRQAWQAEPSDLQIEPDFITAAPGIVVPLGDTDGSSWSLVVPSGSELRISGDGARSLIEMASSLQTSFVWGHLVGHAGDEEARGLAFATDRSDAHSGSAILVEDASRPHVVVDASGIVVEDAGLHIPASVIHPIITEVLEPTAAEAPVWSTAIGSLIDEGRMVRLLTPMPRIDGLSEPIDPKRSRRAVEVVAYLVLHHPEPVTGDRLRSRVLGSSTRDAASKTLFNVTSAARRALGKHDDGASILPSADRTGHYRAGDHLGSDLALLLSHIDSARSATRDDERMAHLRAGLSMIEGEPLAAVLAGWDWFNVEGHRARLEGLVEAAGVELADLAIAAGLLDLAELAIERSRMVVKWSEPIAARAMELAAARGDLMSLRRAFDDLGLLLDELDPGSWPDPVHETRFGELVEAVRSGRPQASFAAMDAAPRSTSPSAPAAL